MVPTVEDIRRLLASDDTDYDKAAEFGEEALPSLEILSSDPEPYIAAKAVYLAGKIGGPDASRMIERSAASSNSYIRQSVASAVRLPGVSLDPSVTEGLLDDPEPDVRKIMLISLKESGLEQHRDKVADLAARDPIPYLRNMAAQLTTE